MRGIHRGPVNSPHKWPVARKCFHLMTSSWLSNKENSNTWHAVKWSPSNYRAHAWTSELLITGGIYASVYQTWVAKWMNFIVITASRHAWVVLVFFWPDLINQNTLDWYRKKLFDNSYTPLHILRLLCLLLRLFQSWQRVTLIILFVGTYWVMSIDTCYVYILASDWLTTV